MVILYLIPKCYLRNREDLKTLICLSDIIAILSPK